MSQEKNRISNQMFGFISLFNGISTFVGYLIAKSILVEELLRSFLTESWRRDKEVHTFPKGMSPKVNLLPGFEFELG